MDLGTLLKNLGRSANPDVLVGFETSDDAGVFRLSEDLALVQTVDFITPVSDDPWAFGQIAAANSLSDVYAMGGKPLTALNICCFPPTGVPPGIYARILEGSLDKITEAGAVLLGGHTVKDEELKYGLSVTGIVHPSRILRNSGARPGDALVLTKPVGTGVLITGSRRGLVRSEVFDRVIDRMARLNRNAGQAAVAHSATGCTDITGFGLAGHALEMARGSGVGIRLSFASIPHYPESLDLIAQGVRTGVTHSNRELVGEAIRFASGLDETRQWLMFDPQTSGGLLISLPAANAQGLLDDLLARGEGESRLIGEVFAAPAPVLSVEA